MSFYTVKGHHLPDFFAGLRLFSLGDMPCVEERTISETVTFPTPFLVTTTFLWDALSGSVTTEGTGAKLLPCSFFNEWLPLRFEKHFLQ